MGAGVSSSNDLGEEIVTVKTHLFSFHIDFGIIYTNTKAISSPADWLGVLLPWRNGSASDFYLEIWRLRVRAPREVLFYFLFFLIVHRN